MNTADYLLANGASDQPALISERETVSYQELRQRTARLAAFFISLNCAPGDRIAIMDTNSPQWVACYLACLKLGLVAVPIAPSLPRDEINRVLAFIQPKAAYISRVYQRLIDEPGETTIISESNLSTLTVEDWPQDFWSGNWDEDAALMFTSGTTLRPRLVRITHHNIQANTDSICTYLDLQARDRIMASLQFFYCFGTSLLHSHLRVGGSLVLSRTFMYPEVVLNQMEAQRCTGFAGVPSNYQTLLRNSTFPRRSLPTLAKIQQAGGKLQTPLIRELMAAAPQAQIYVMYGQTEATARLSYLPPQDLHTKLGSIGKGIPGVQLKVVDENGDPVADNQPGEVIATGENISPGYWRNEAASQDKFVNGSLHTGDMAVRDADGYLYIVDRSADFIKTSGYRVSSQSIEECILELPQTVAAAVIGVPDAQRGEAILAFVVPRSGEPLEAGQIMEHCRHRLTQYMVPRKVIFLDHLPVNAHGKIVKNELRSLAAQTETEAVG